MWDRNLIKVIHVTSQGTGIHIGIVKLVETDYTGLDMEGTGYAYAGLEEEPLPKSLHKKLTKLRDNI
jgi:hypothetical protein